MADLKSTRQALDGLSEVVVMAEGIAKALDEAAGESGAPSWVWVFQRQIGLIVEAVDAVETAFTREVAALPSPCTLSRIYRKAKSRATGPARIPILLRTPSPMSSPSVLGSTGAAVRSSSAP